MTTQTRSSISATSSPAAPQVDEEVSQLQKRLRYGEDGVDNNLDLIGGMNAPAFSMRTWAAASRLSGTAKGQTAKKLQKWDTTFVEGNGEPDYLFKSDRSALLDNSRSAKVARKTTSQMRQVIQSFRPGGTKNMETLELLNQQADEHVRLTASSSALPFEVIPAMSRSHLELEVLPEIRRRDNPGTPAFLAPLYQQQRSGLQRTGSLRASTPLQRTGDSSKYSTEMTLWSAGSNPSTGGAPVSCVGNTFLRQLRHKTYHPSTSPTKEELLDRDEPGMELQATQGSQKTPQPPTRDSGASTPDPMLSLNMASLTSQVTFTIPSTDPQFEATRDVDLPREQNVNYVEMYREQEIVERDRAESEVVYHRLVRELDEHMLSVRETFNLMLEGKFRVKPTPTSSAGSGHGSSAAGSPTTGKPRATILVTDEDFGSKDGRKISFVLPSDEPKSNVPNLPAVGGSGKRVG
jgi:hypothetical protein